MSSTNIEAVAARLDALVRRFEEHPDPGTRAAVLELLGAVDALHRPGLDRLVRAFADAAPHAFERLVDEPEIRTLLELYELLPPPERVAVEQALATVAGELAAPGSLVLLDLLDGVAHVRVEQGPAGARLADDVLVRRLRIACRDIPGVRDVALHGSDQRPAGRMLPMVGGGGQRS